MNNKIKQFLLISSMYLLNPSASAFDFNQARETAPLMLPQERVQATGEVSSLVRDLSQQLEVSPTQATGGLSAMFGYARNAVDAETYAKLENSVDGLSSLTTNRTSGGLPSASMLAGLDSMAGVNKVFSAMGLESGMVQQFAPIVLSFLESQGVGGPILGTLKGLWQPA